MKDQEKYGSVLVVDDNPGVLEASSLILTEYGFQVISSSSAGDAMNAIQSNGIDVVVTDIVMPVTSGTELLRQVHDIDPKIPVILMTAYANMEKVIDAIKIGAFDFIIKPFTPELLVHSVEKAIQYNSLSNMEKDYRHLLEEYNHEIETLIAERTMSLMALTLADKIRNPASVIGLTSRRILEKEQVPEHLRSKLNDILNEAEKLNDLVREFQSLLHSKKSMFKYEDVNEIVGSIIFVVRNKALKKGVELVFNKSENPLRANMQKNLFQIAVSHLINNAIEATPGGGKIIVSTVEEGNDVVLTISDTGYGIEKEDINKIFDPLFSSKAQRFGMGLPLVKRIVTEHMGVLTVESSQGKGTTFVIRMPLRWTRGK